jgi:uncharacterized cupredoxin-like copper-binding protein
MGSHRLRLVLIIAFTAVLLGVGSTAVMAAAGPLNPRGPIQSAWPSCATPALSGAVVDVTLTDMGAMMGSSGGGPYGPAMMGPGMMGPGWNGPNPTAAPPNGYGWQNGYPAPGMGMMRIFANPATVPAGPVSLRARNTGMMIHEVMVVPLGAGHSPGQLAIGVNGQVDESASLAEASRSCGPDDGDGILPATTGWTTVTLTPGRYELLCNIAGHYGAGMYTELDVVSSR